MVTITPGPSQQSSPKNGVFRHEHARMQAHAVANRHVMLDHALRADAHVVADDVLLADQRAVPGLEVRADAVARVDHRM